MRPDPPHRPFELERPAAVLATTVGQLARFVTPLTMDSRSEQAHDAFAADPNLFAIAIVDEAGRPAGILNRFRFLERLSQRYGRELIVARPASQFMESEVLVMDEGTSLDDFGDRLVAQGQQSMFDGFVITRHGLYAGVGTGIDLLRALTERRHAELRQMALHDMLTGLPNRRLFDQRLDEALASGAKCAILFLDLDRFKTVNDTYGHRFGDLLLCRVAERLRSSVRATDIVARLSGDEFALMLPDINTSDDADAIARVLVASCAAPMAVENVEVAVSCSIGVAIFPDDGPDRDALLRAADAAQYQAKEVRNSWQRYTSEMAAWRSSLPALAALRQAIDTGGLSVVYQPIVHIDTRRIVGLEALVRWVDPVRGPIPAQDIIAIAEESGLIVPLGQVVIRQAMRDMAAWDRTLGLDGVTLAVNISAVQIQEGRLVAMLDGLADETGFDLARLEIELTESGAMRASVPALATLHALRQRGCRVTMDDFGTGYSALSRLERLPIDAMKIDKSFLQGIGEHGRGGIIARAMIAMARALGLRLVAEGVETAEQLEFLRREGCGLAQGFLFSKPLPAQEVEALLAGRTL